MEGSYSAPASPGALAIPSGDPGYVFVPVRIDDLRTFPTTDVRMGAAAGGRMPTLGEFLEETFFPDKENLRYLTLRGYRSHLKLHILPYMEGMRLDEIGYSEIQRMLNRCPTRKAAKDSRGVLSAVLGHAVRVGLLRTNQALGAYVYPDAIEPKQAPLGTWLTNFSQIALMLRAAREYDPGGEMERLCLIGYGSGLRKGEILALNGSDIDLDRGALTVNKSYTRGRNGPEMHGTKTPTAVRELPLLDYVWQRLREIDFDDGPFITYRGKRSNPSSIAKRFAAFRDAKGLIEGCTIHSMRGSFCTAMLNEGRSVAIMQAWLGHSSPTTLLKWYARPCAADMYEDARQASRTLTAALRSQDIVFEPLDERIMKDVADALGEVDPRAESVDFATSPRLGPNREEQFMELIASDPYITSDEIAERLDISPTLTLHIIRMMRRRKQLRKRKGEWRLCA